MIYKIKQFEPFHHKGFTGTAFHLQLYDTYFGWVKNVEGLVFYEAESLEILEYAFQENVDGIIAYTKYIPHGYTNAEYIFDQLKKDKSYDEMTRLEQDLYDRSIDNYRCRLSKLRYDKKQAIEEGRDYRYCRSILEIQDLGFEIGHLTSILHIAESLLAKGISPDIIKEVCGLTEEHMNYIK